MIDIGQAGIVRCRSGSVAVEFAMVLPAMAALILGALFSGLLMFSTASLHYAVEQAARCYSVNVSQCNSASQTSTYAQNQYYGVSNPTFTVSAPSCGHQVNGTLTFVLNAGITKWNVPLSATACFP
jgi:Flp pilus assembly protein TadG